MRHIIEKDWVTRSGLRAVILVIEWTDGNPHHRCGYVEVPEDHKAFGKSYYTSTFDECGNKREIGLIEQQINGIEIHGGLTYSSSVAGESYPASGSGWWFGFDCIHLGDRPITECGGGYSDPMSTAKSLSYVAGECEELARQLQEIK